MLREKASGGSTENFRFGKGIETSKFLGKPGDRRRNAVLVRLAGGRMTIQLSAATREAVVERRAAAVRDAFAYMGCSWPMLC